MSGKLNSELRDQLRAFALDTLYWPNRAKKIVEKQDFFHSVANDIGISEELLYLEFGVAHGKSLTEIAKLFINSNSRFIGFDSFTGLPEDWLMHEKGAFSNQGRPPSIEDDRIQFIQGWYQNTVPLHLERISRKPHRQVLVHIDSDLYASALFLLTQLWSAFDEYYFMFDDFVHDEAVALSDFTQAFPVKLEFLIQTRGGGDGPNPDQVFGRMVRTEMRVD